MDEKKETSDQVDLEALKKLAEDVAMLRSKVMSGQNINHVAVALSDRAVRIMYQSGARMKWPGEGKE